MPPISQQVFTSCETWRSFVYPDEVPKESGTPQSSARATLTQIVRRLAYVRSVLLCRQFRWFDPQPTAEFVSGGQQWQSCHLRVEVELITLSAASWREAAKHVLGNVDGKRPALLIRGVVDRAGSPQLGSMSGARLPLKQFEYLRHRDLAPQLGKINQRQSPAPWP